MRIKLIELRNAKKLSRLDMANAINKTVSFYGKIERGNRNPSLDDAKTLASMVEASVDEIFFSNECDNLPHSSQPTGTDS